MPGDDVIQRLFDKIESIRDDVTFIKVKMEEREKNENAQKLSAEKIEGRVKSLELWRAGQQGVTAVIQHWGPVLITAGIALYVAVRGRG